MSVVFGRGAQQAVSGTYVGTGAAVTVVLGFTPTSIQVFNETDGDDAWTWDSSLPAAHAKRESATAGLVTSNGITVSGRSVTFGSALSESGQTFRYIAR